MLYKKTNSQQIEPAQVGLYAERRGHPRVSDDVDSRELGEPATDQHETTAGERPSRGETEAETAREKSQTATAKCERKLSVDASSFVCRTC